MDQDRFVPNTGGIWSIRDVATKRDPLSDFRPSENAESYAEGGSWLILLIFAACFDLERQNGWKPRPNDITDPPISEKTG